MNIQTRKTLFGAAVFGLAMAMSGCSASGGYANNTADDRALHGVAVVNDTVASAAVVPTSAAVEFSTTQVEIARAAMMMPVPPTPLTP